MVANSSGLSSGWEDQLQLKCLFDDSAAVCMVPKLLQLVRLGMPKMYENAPEK